MQTAKPDYEGGGIVNLMSSIIQGRGGRSAYPSLERLSPQELSRATNVVLLIVDGLGADWLSRTAPDSLLARSSRGDITSVFPPTTAAAITTYLTGEAPLQHGLTGWFTYLRELGCVMTVLPGTPRYGGVSYRRAGIDPSQLFPGPTVFERISTRGFSVAPAYIAYSDFNQARTAGAEVVPYETLADMLRQALRILRPSRRWMQAKPATERKYLYLYWPRLDAIGHELGMESEAASAHLAEIDRAVADFICAARGTDTIVIVCADHGQIDSRPEAIIDLRDHPRLSECLVLPLCGEPRAAFCYLRAGYTQQFLSYCREELEGLVDLVPSRELVDAGYFGTGPSHPRLSERIGDYCILPRGQGVIRESLAGERPHQQIGVHGGLSHAELMVPLCVLEA